jgi:hypothetical protein
MFYKSNISRICTILICLFLIIFGGGNAVESSVCTVIGKVQIDGNDECDYLGAKMIGASGPLAGIVVNAGEDPLELEINTALIGTRTWGSGGNLTWTFNAGDVDPSLKFASNNIYLQNGRLAVNVETDPTENTACSLFVGDNVDSEYGIYQFEPGSKNYFWGNTAVGEDEPEDGIGLFVSKIFDTDASNYGEKISVSQDTLPTEPSNPGGLTCEFDYNASGTSEFQIETDLNNKFKFIQGSTVV